MRIKTNLSVLLIGGLLIANGLFAQNTQNQQATTVPLEAFTFDDLSEDFLEIKKNGMEFYDAQISTHGIEAISKEGSPYIQFIRYIEEWEEILSPFDYSYDTYYKSTSKSSENTPIKTCEWEELGPVVPSLGTSYIAGIGHTEFMRIAKHDPSKMLAGSIYGGLFFSSNAGVSWQSVSDEWSSGGCSWADFSETNQGVIVATTAIEQYNTTGKSGGMTRYGGVMMSSDYGQTWKKILSSNTISPYTKLNKVVFSPVTSNQIYLGMTGGLYRYITTAVDNASYLTLVKNFDVPGVFESTACVDIELILNPDLFPSTPFIAVTVGGYTPGVTNSYHTKAYVSYDGGANFTEVFTNIGTKKFSSFEYSAASAQNQGTLNQAVIHFNASVGGSNSVWTLNLTNLAENQLGSTSTTNVFGGCFAFAVNNFDDDKIVVSRYTGLFGTHNGFTTTSNTMTSSGLHSDIEHFIWHPTNEDELWVCTHGGVERSLDAGVTWKDMSIGLGVANVNTFDDASSSSSKILLALEHDGTVRLDNAYNQSNLNHDWVYFRGGDALGATIIENGDLNFYFSSGQSTNSTGYATSYGPSASSLGFSMGVVYNAWFEPSTTRESVYTPGGSSSQIEVYQSDLVAGQQPTRYSISDFATTPGFTTDYRIRRINSSVTDKAVLFASGWKDWTSGGVDYLLMMNRNANDPNPQNVKNSWVELVMPYDNTTDRNKIAFRDVISSHHIEGRYYIGTSGGYNGSATNQVNAVFSLQLNSNGTHTIVDITGNLENCGIGGAKDYTMIVEKGTHEGIYISTFCGVFYLHGDDLDAGNFNWQEIGTGLPNVKKNGIKANYQINMMRVGTFGRGLWEGCFVCPEDDWSNETGVSPSKFLEVNQFINSTAVIPPSTDVKYRAGTVIDLKPGFYATPGSDFLAFIHPCGPYQGNSFRSAKVNPWENIDMNSLLKEQDATLSSNTTNIVNIYPNPTDHQLTLSLENEIEGKADIKIIDVTGSIIREWTTEFRDENIVVSDLSPGIYTLTITIGDKHQNVRFVKR